MLRFDYLNPEQEDTEEETEKDKKEEDTEEKTRRWHKRG